MSLLNLLDDYQVKNSLLNSIELTSRCLQDFLIHYRLLIPSIYIQQESGKQINFITMPAHKISLTTPLKNQAVKQTTTLANNRFYTPYILKLIFDFVYLRITKVSLGKTYSAHKSCLTGYGQNTAFLVKNKVDKSSLRITRKQAVNAAIKGLQAKCGFGNPSTYVNVDRQYFKILGWPAYKACLTGLVKNPLAKLIKSLTTIGHNVLFWSKQKSSFVLLRPAKISLRLLLASGLGSGYDDCVHPHGESGLVTSQYLAHIPRLNAVFLCVPFGYAASMVWLNGDAFERASFLSDLLTNPVQSSHPHLVMNGSTSNYHLGAHTHA